MNKRQEIIEKVGTIKKGVLFDCDTIISESYRRGDVAVIFCELKKKGEIKSLSKGVFYKPEMSSFGLGELPLDKEEIVKFFSKKLDAHISGQYGYNMLGLTEQNAQTITLAGKHPFKEFSVQNCRFNYMKSGVGYVEKNKLSIAILLDALNNIERISGKTGNEAFQILKGKITRMLNTERNMLIKIGEKYPTKTKYLLSKACEEINHRGSIDLRRKISNISKYDIEYKHTVTT